MVYYLHLSCWHDPHGPSGAVELLLVVHVADKVLELLEVGQHVPLEKRRHGEQQSSTTSD